MPFNPAPHSFDTLRLCMAIAKCSHDADVSARDLLGLSSLDFGLACACTQEAGLISLQDMRPALTRAGLTYLRAVLSPAADLVAVLDRLSPQSKGNTR